MSRFGLCILGGGPAGTGVLLAALKSGRLGDLLDRGVCVVERSPWLMRGSLGGYAIDSDTLADVLLECLDGPARTLLADALVAPATDVVRRHLGGPIPLSYAGDFLATVGASLHAALAAHPRTRALCETTVLHARRRRDGYEVTVRRADGTTETLHATALVSALGGHQDIEALLDAPITPGVHLRDEAWRTKVIPSARVLTGEGMSEVDARLAQCGAPQVVVIGSSHSAVSCVRVLLERVGSRLGVGAVTLMARRRPRVFYPSREEAERDGYTDFTDGDVCPTTGRVHRLGGLRLQARQCAREFLGIERERREERVRILPLTTADRDAVVTTLNRANVIIPALGYRPRAVPLYDRDGARVAYQSDDGRGALVDRWCRALDARGAVIDNVYAIGLASGFVPWGAMGGEPAFRGQTNGLWLYQHHVGALIVDQLLGVVQAQCP